MERIYAFNEATDNNPGGWKDPNYECFYDIDRLNIKRDVHFWVSPTGTANAIANIPRYGKARVGGEVVIIRNGQIYGQVQSTKMIFPAGSLDPEDTSLMQAAVREAQEEALINVSDVRYVGLYLFKPSKSSEWVKKKVPTEYQWEYYYREVFVGKYKSKYKGDIAEEDIDLEMQRAGWHKIEDIYHLLNETQKKAVKYITNSLGL